MNQKTGQHVRGESTGLWVALCVLRLFSLETSNAEPKMIPPVMLKTDVFRPLGCWVEAALAL